MIGILSAHRRLAELTNKAMTNGGWLKLPVEEQKEVEHCLRLNASIIGKLEDLRTLSIIAADVNDQEWQLDICRQLQEIEDKFAKER